MKAGAPLGVWVWADAPGDTWHLRSTTAKGDAHRVTGRVLVDEGALAKGRPYQLEAADKFQSGKQELTFSFVTDGIMDGLDFALEGSKCVRFEILVDGAARPELVNIGPRPYHPGSAVFRLCR